MRISSLLVVVTLIASASVSFSQETKSATPDAHALPPGAAGFNEYGPANSAALCRELSEAIVPLVERTYKVAARPRSRAFAGLSMGGHHALTVALNHHDPFGWIGAFRSAPPP